MYFHICGEKRKTKNLILRCYALKDDDSWQAFCLDFSLAAQTDTLFEANAKLEDMVKEYVFDALVGQDKEHSEQLVNRKTPLSEWLKFYWLVAKRKILNIKDGLQCSFQPLPLTPYNHHVWAGIIRRWHAKK